LPGAGYKYKFLNKEYEDSFALNVTETDFRHYDSAIGRFSSMDLLSELAYDFTPYRYGFNNPVYWQDKTGLFESRGAAQEWIDTWGLTGANIYYNPHKGVYQIENNGVSFYQLGEDIISHMYSMDTGELLYTITRGAAASGGGSDGSSGMNWAQINQGAGAFGFANGVKTGLIEFAGKTGELSKGTKTYLNSFKILGKGLGVASAGISAYDAIDYYSNGGKGSEVAIKAGLDATMALIGAFGGPVGFGVSAIYFIADYATDGFGVYGAH